MAVKLACPRCAVCWPESTIVCRYCGYAFGHLKPEQRQSSREAAVSGAWEFQGWKWRVEHRPLIGGGLAGSLLVLSTLAVGLGGGFGLGLVLLKILRGIGLTGTFWIPASIGAPAVAFALGWYRIALRPFFRMYRVMRLSSRQAAA